MEGISTATKNGFGSLFSDVTRAEKDAGPFEHSARIAVLRNITVEGLEAFVKHHLYSSGIRPEMAFGGFGTMMHDILSEDAPLRSQTAEADLVVVSLTLEEFDPAYGSPGWRAADVKAELDGLFNLLETRSRATIAVNTFIPPLHPDLGIMPARDGSDLASQVADLNRHIVEFVRGHAPRFLLTDWNRYLALAGADAALDARGRYLWKAPFKPAFLDLYAQDLARMVRALKGRAKKCLILDCDNTLWGGVLGEDGLDGIKLDRNEYPGKAYYDFQTSILGLAERGVLVALCSKNNDVDVFEALDTHPWCRLKRSHLAAWRLNWQDKAANIVELAAELNLGLDSFVFVDDNPVECELIRKLLPDVTVLEVPQKLHELSSLVARQGLFDTLSLTDEDRSRTQLYETDALRKSVRGTFGGLDEYLASLGTVATIHRVLPKEIARVAQLTQKTNQFNLTTRRYSERDIQDFADREDVAVFTLSVADRFGDMGLVGVLIAERTGKEAHVDTLLLSCRVLGRGLEQAMVVHCLSSLNSAWSVERWQAEYVPTRKNMQVADFWSRTGFVLAAETDGRKTYQRSEQDECGDVPGHISLRTD